MSSGTLRRRQDQNFDPSSALAAVRGAGGDRSRPGPALRRGGRRSHGRIDRMNPRRSPQPDWAPRTWAPSSFCASPCGACFLRIPWVHHGRRAPTVPFARMPWTSPRRKADVHPILLFCSRTMHDSRSKASPRRAATLCRQVFDGEACTTWPAPRPLSRHCAGRRSRQFAAPRPRIRSVRSG
jgi:hypothetical protein